MSWIWLAAALVVFGIGLVVGGAFAAFGLRFRDDTSGSGPHQRLVRQALMRAAAGRDEGVIESLTQR